MEIHTAIFYLTILGGFMNFCKKKLVMGLMGFLLVTLTASWSTGVLANSGDLKVRRNIAYFTEADIALLRQGIGVMKSRGTLDPTSLMFQANIHGSENETDPHYAWDQCPHGNLLFLAWHRLYIYYFDKILRAGTSDSSFTLPFWNYSDPSPVSSQLPYPQALPTAYRDPTDGDNPLFHPGRLINPPPNNPPPQMPESAIDYERAFGQTDWQSFGDSVESTPHNPVHVAVGGDMGFVPIAARDPIFYLHHNNIDRLWNRWLDLGGGRENPTPCEMDNLIENRKVKSFLQKRCEMVCQRMDCQFNPQNWEECKSARVFFFYDEQRSEHPMSAIEMMRVANDSRSLGYKFDDAPSLISDKVYELGMTNRVVHLKHEALAKAFSAKAVKITLRIEGIKPKNKRFPSAYYEIYLNIPEGSKVNTDDIAFYNKFKRHHIGNLGFFGMHSHGNGHTDKKYTVNFDITEVARYLAEHGMGKDDTYSLTFVVKAKPVLGDKEKVIFSQILINGQSNQLVSSESPKNQCPSQ
jgi:hypothetical protein